MSDNNQEDEEMRKITLPEATFPTSDFGSSAMFSSSSMAQSALQLTREAIARWSGSASPATARGDLSRVSPQARWLSKAQQDLTAWIEGGGFSQIGDTTNPALMPSLSGSLMVDTAALNAWSLQCRADACCD